jgi:hypothetical protein
MQGVPLRRRRQRRANVGVAEVIALEKQGVVKSKVWPVAVASA